VKLTKRGNGKNFSGGVLIGRRTGIDQKLGVTQSECDRLRTSCDKRLEEITSDIRLIKSALVGTDMRGGLVNQVNNLSVKLNDIISTQHLTDETRNKEKETSNKREADTEAARYDVHARYKVAIIGLVGSLAGLALAFFLSKL
jgi:hypothetical protein